MRRVLNRTKEKLMAWQSWSNLRFLALLTATLLACGPRALAQGPGRSTGGIYIGGYSGGNSRGGNVGTYIGGYPGGLDRGNGDGSYIGGYPSSFSGYNYPSNPPGSYPSLGYRGYTTPVYPYPDRYYKEPSREAAAVLDVRVPANAELWFDGYKSKQTGPQREFQTPRLAAGKKYTYTVRARWVADGKPVEETRQISFTPGQQVKVSFPAPAP
jgi:uncharacterized protein (TIGR03000 family)